MKTTAQLNIVRFTSLNVPMATVFLAPLCVTTGMTVGTTVMSKAVCTRAAVVVSSHAPVAGVSLSSGCVTNLMTVGTTVTREDVIATLEAVIPVSGAAPARQHVSQWVKCVTANQTVQEVQMRPTQQPGKHAAWIVAPL